MKLFASHPVQMIESLESRVCQVETFVRLNTICQSNLRNLIYETLRRACIQREARNKEYDDSRRFYVNLREI